MLACCVNNYIELLSETFGVNSMGLVIAGGNVITYDFFLSHLSRIVNGSILLMIFLGVYLGL
jgi:type IV secretory pathway VirB6-like protein